MSDSEHERAVNNRRTIEYCVNNVTSAARKRIETCSGGAQGYPCLERCGTCRQDPFLVVDGEIHRAETHRELLSRSSGGDVNA